MDLDLDFQPGFRFASQEVRICYGEMTTVTWNIRGGPRGTDLQGASCSF